MHNLNESYTNLLVNIHINNYRPYIRFNIIDEIVKNSAASFAFMSCEERFYELIDDHYFSPFENIYSIVDHYSDLVNELKNIITDLPNYSLTEHELQLLILLYKRNFYPAAAKFYNIIKNVDFKVIDENLNLITDDYYLNGVERKCDDIQNEMIKQF